MQLINLDLILKLGLALLFSFLIGYERENQDKPAGLRDIMLVTLGSTLLTLIAYKIASLNPNNDLGRIISYTVASIGFLGSGVIIRDKHTVEGITTATLLWVMVSIGILCGSGELFLAGVSSIIIYLILKLKYFRVKIQIIKNKCLNKTEK